MTPPPVSFDLLRRLEGDEQAWFIDCLEREVAPRLVTAPKGYARGRRSAWLAWEPPLGDKFEVKEQPKGELWRRLKELLPDAETAECWRNGRESSRGIHPHMDSSYAAPLAYLLNLGETRFRLWLPREEVPHALLARKKVNAKLIEYQASLEGGELIAFNCKRYHGSQSDADSRWGIGLWSFKREWRDRARFISSETGQPLDHSANP